MKLIPLQRSAVADDVESEFKALFLQLFKDHIDEGVSELALYGMPHLGSMGIIERYVSNDGLAVLRTTTVEQIRYLFHAWRYNNPQRGTAFLSAYLNALFGPVFTISQLWCHKDGNYPSDALTQGELEAEGGDLEDYYLTSRLRVDIETEIVPERIMRAARTAVAAKFVLELRAARRTFSRYGVQFIGNSVLVCRTSGTAEYLQPAIESPASVGLATIVGGSTFTYSISGGRDTQSHLN
jgi:hypothetical protein